ncbi:MAG TPA: ATP-binding cassette domain-containing protein, partial [Spongiibacteraceae bacterium]|nr:ATP-binding cassette domain-containing protein [Spongiibacteraceae bacterium]
LAAADDVLATLRDELETRIGDRGATLSGGQRQRLSLARALLAEPDILVLDDATSALDAVTERTVLNNLRGLSQPENYADGCRSSEYLSTGAPTVLIIASKLSSILLADRVLLLADGRIAAQGRHEELARSNAAYRDLLGIDSVEVAHG